MQTILVPTDFSKTATNAAEYAANFAKEINARVILFHVFHTPIPISEVPVMTITPQEIQVEKEMQLKKEAVNLQEKTGADISYLVKMGLAVDEILEEEKNVSLIVMGMEGASKLSEALMGSITTATLRKAKTPVLVIPENVIYRTPKQIVLACDYDPRTDAHTLDALKKLMKAFDPKIYVVNVKQKSEPVTKEKTTGSQLEAELADMQHTYFFPENEDPVEGINDFVEEKKADIIAIIPHHHNLFEQLFHKSISKRMAFRTHVPLLALPDNHKSIPAYL
jgi:nucleotide-binding universal stress UspA family protein